MIKNTSRRAAAKPPECNVAEDSSKPVKKQRTQKTIKGEYKMVIVGYRILVAGEDEMKVYAHYKTEADAISSAKRLKKERIGSVIVQKVTVEDIKF